MVAGRVVRFDGTRGYGFIAPAHGGEDVFLHVNDLLIPEMYVRSGVQVEFEIQDGERGLKASAVRLAGEAAARLATVVPAAPTVPAVPLEAAGAAPADASAYPLCDVLSEDECTRDVTEILLGSVPELTGDQVVRIRRELVSFAKIHSWVEG